MAINRLGIRKEPMGFGDFQGLSTDTKPLPSDTQGVIDGSTFYELDTKALYVYSTTNVNPATGNGWWDV